MGETRIMKGKERRTKTSPIFPDSRMQRSLEGIICRVKLLEEILVDASNYQSSYTIKKDDKAAVVREKNKLKKTNKDILRGYVNQSDLDKIVNKQTEINNLKKTGKDVSKLETDYITEVLDKALPKDELTEIYHVVTDIIEKKEEAMLRFIQNKLIPKFFVDGKGNELEYTVQHTYEVRCRDCDETTLKVDQVSVPRKDKEFFISFKKGELDKDCETKNCKGDTFYVSAGNQFKVVKDALSKYAIEMGARMKSAGRFVDKFIDILTDLEPERSNQMFDSAALRDIGVNEEACIYMSEVIVKIARQEYGRIIKPLFKNFPRKDFSASPEHSRIKINLPMKTTDYMGNSYTEHFEIQIMDPLAKHTEKENKKINHKRYIEKQNALRRAKRNPIYDHIKPYLMTIFDRMDPIMKLPTY